MRAERGFLSINFGILLAWGAEQVQIFDLLFRYDQTVERTSGKCSLRWDLVIGS